MVKRQTPHKKTIAQLSVSSSRTKGRQTSLKIPLRLLSSFDGKQEDLDEPLQTVLVHGLHLDITWKSLDCLSWRGLLASPVIRRSSGRYLYILIVFFKTRHISIQAFMIIHGLGLAQVCNNEEHRGASHGNRDLESQAGKKSAISSRRSMNRRLDFPPKDLPIKAILNLTAFNQSDPQPLKWTKSNLYLRIKKLQLSQLCSSCLDGRVTHFVDPKWRKFREFLAPTLGSSPVPSLALQCLKAIERLISRGFWRARRMKGKNTKAAWLWIQSKIRTPGSSFVGMGIMEPALLQFEKWKKVKRSEKLCKSERARDAKKRWNIPKHT